MAMLAATTTPLSASSAWLLGEWCDASGDERLIADAHGFGFNEHTVCTIVHANADSGSEAITGRCATVYPDGESIVRMDERTVEIEPAPDHSSLTARSGDAAPITFRRCQH
jgi:hypothetical protein